MSTKKIVLSVAGALLVLTASPMLGRPATSPSSVQHQSEQPSKTFSGTIIKDGENFVLNDAANKTSYMLPEPWMRRATRSTSKPSKKPLS